VNSVTPPARPPRNMESPRDRSSGRGGGGSIGSRGGRDPKKLLPSYMRSTKAMEQWKTQTEAVKKKPKHLRVKEIY
jgi:hypothetical protein